MQALHFHWPHEQNSFSLIAMILGVVALPPLIIWMLFLIAGALLGGVGVHNVH